ncbi:hypothetical protein M0R45_018086 [Rubus argutus]|uniref:Uncharacterized protein n=1 Tax=Rubus argutus TaxID=59490 RepID=A0AAW1Y0X9_RUBAR
MLRPAAHPWGVVVRRRVRLGIFGLPWCRLTCGGQGGVVRFVGLADIVVPSLVRTGLLAVVRVTGGLGGCRWFGGWLVNRVASVWKGGWWWMDWIASVSVVLGYPCDLSWLRIHKAMTMVRFGFVGWVVACGARSLLDLGGSGFLDLAVGVRQVGATAMEG